LHVLKRFIIIVSVRDDISNGSNYEAVTMKLKVIIHEAEGHASYGEYLPGRGCRLMPPVPVLRPREVVKTFEKLGNMTDDY
jgi:hypothetical protein